MSSRAGSHIALHVFGGQPCEFHTRMIMNMLQLLAQSNILLTRKMEHIAKRTTREKLLLFLTMQTSLAKRAVVELPFNRQELADYFCVDRSALSRELGAMRAEGILRCNGNGFELLGSSLPLFPEPAPGCGKCAGPDGNTFE